MRNTPATPTQAAIMIIAMPCVTEYCMEMLGPRTITNEKVELGHCIDYTAGAVVEDFVRDH